jgi:trk system potassium uptake protein
MPNETSPQIAVIGLGAFGMALVKTLAKEGANVIAVDNNMDHLDEVKNITSNAICFDSTDPVQLKSHGITDVDIAVIAIGENFEPVVLIAMELIKSGVHKVYARANSETQEQILTKIGVSEIIHPERQVAERMGVTLHRKGIEDLLEIGDGLSIFEVDVPESMVNHTLTELNLRKRYGVNILTIKRLKKDQSDATSEKTYQSLGIPGGSTKLKEGDKFVILGNKKDCDKMLELN